MFGWLLNIAYLLLIAAASPLLIWRAARQGKYREGWREKFLGRLPTETEGQQVVWLHAVSVGEVLQLRPVVAQLLQTRPQLRILITTTTTTGRAVAAETFPNCRIAYFPLDFTWSVRAALRRTRPCLLGLVELELWPNLIREAAAEGIPLMLINGRMSARSFRGYRRIRPLIGGLLRKFQYLAVQTEEYAHRLIHLGAPEDRVEVTGSIKFDGVRLAGLSDHSESLRKAFAIARQDRIFIAGSTHAPEEQAALDAWARLRNEFPELRLILVPRHQERFEEVAAIVQRKGFPLIRRSRSVPYPAPEPTGICLLDTLGELSACWPLAEVAFVGGSLTCRGGQNMIEPAAAGIPVVVGPDTSNFRDVVEGLRSVDGIRVIPGEAELTEALRSLLRDRSAAAEMGERARQFVSAQQGAAERTVRLMHSLLPVPPRQSRNAA